MNRNEFGLSAPCSIAPLPGFPGRWCDALFNHPAPEQVGIQAMWCNATRAIDTFGSQQALTTSSLNSALYRRQGRFSIRVSIVSTYPLVDTIFLVAALKLQMGSPPAYVFLSVRDRAV